MVPSLKWTKTIHVISSVDQFYYKHLKHYILTTNNSLNKKTVQDMNYTVTQYIKGLFCLENMYMKLH